MTDDAKPYSEQLDVYYEHMAKLQAELQDATELVKILRSEADALRDDVRGKTIVMRRRAREAYSADVLIVAARKKYDACEAENAKLLERLAELTTERDELRIALAELVQAASNLDEYLPRLLRASDCIGSYPALPELLVELHSAAEKAQHLFGSGGD